MKVFVCTEENTFYYPHYMYVVLSILDTNFRGFRR